MSPPDHEGAITPQPSLEVTEQANIMEIKAESKKLEGEDEYDREDGDDKEDYDGGDEDHDYEEEKEKAKEINQSMWKTRLLPEEGTAQNWNAICLVKCGEVVWGTYLCSWNSLILQILKNSSQLVPLTVRKTLDCIH